MSNRPNCAAMQTPLGTLSRVDVRDAWQNEATDFTPWLALAPNLQLLGETIGLQLELEAVERNVGPFRADILCKEVGSDRWILIENQLEQTDHTHMGQLITYAAGLDAVTIVWIAREFREEHRAALDWLNSVTGTDIHFFGLEVELWQIGDSALAPKFNLISQPNDWSKTVRPDPSPKLGISGTQNLQLRFWTAFREYLNEHSSILRPPKPYPCNWMSFAVGRSGFTLAAVTSFWNNEAGEWNKGELRAEFDLAGDKAKSCYPQLEADKSTIEAELGQPLIWNKSGAIIRIQFRRDADLEDESQWPQYFAWLQEHLEQLNRTFRPRIGQLTAPQ